MKKITLVVQEVVLESSEDEATTAPAEFEATLYDGMGTPVRQGRSQRGRARFDVSTLPNGLYYLRGGQGATQQSQTIRVQH